MTFLRKEGKPRERLLGEVVIVNAHSEASAPFATVAQCAELRTRLACHRSNPGEPGVTFLQLKAQLLTNSRGDLRR